MTLPPNHMRPARRIADVKEYYLQQRMARVAALRSQGIDVVSLGIGGPDTGAPAPAIEALSREALLPEAHNYQLASGTPELKQAMARYYGRTYGVDLDPDTQVLPMLGSKEGILHLTLAMANPGDRILVPDPGYPTYSSATRLAGADPVAYDLIPENAWQPNFDALEKSDLSRVRMMFVNYPHMPTGAPASMQLFEKLVDFGRRHGIIIINDNPYSLILNDKPLSILQVPGAMDTALEMNSLSKSHSMAGWRMGMLVGDARPVGWVRRVKSNIDSGMFAPVMKGARAALDLGQEWHAPLRDMYRRRRRVAVQVMNALGATFDPAQTGLFLWGRVNDSIPDVEQYTCDLLEEAHVFVTPGFIFGRNGSRYIRISLCADEDRLNEALRRIDRYNKNH